MITLVAANTGERLDKWLAGQMPERSRAEIQRWIESGLVTINGHPAKPSRKLIPGDQLTLTIPAPAPSHLQPEALPLTILYEDRDLLVIDKPAGLVVHPAPGHASGTLVNAILHHCPDLEGIGGVRRPGIVHRLDKDTSGILLVAKNDLAHRHLQAQFKARTVEKTYLALVIGHLTPPAGRIDAAIGRDPRHRQRMAVLPTHDGRPALTDYETLTCYTNATLVAAHPRTGRTHQIRVHLAALGHPVVGDIVYGPRRDAFGLGRHFLHAQRLRFRRPSDDAWLDLASPLPPDLQALLDRLAPAHAHP